MMLSPEQRFRDPFDQPVPIPVRQMETAKPLVGSTYSTWYEFKPENDSFRCMAVQPFEGVYDGTYFEGKFNSDDPAWAEKYLGMLKSAGVDFISGEAYDPYGQEPMSTFMRKMSDVVFPLAEHHGIKIMEDYDFLVRSFWSSKLCTDKTCPPGTRSVQPHGFNFDKFPELRTQVINDFELIAQSVVRHTDNYLFLQRDDGTLILEDGKPRPIVGIYIARAWKDSSDYRTIRDIVGKIKDTFHQYDLGTPAFMLDVVYHGDDPYSGKLIEAFGDTAYYLTAFGAVDNGIAKKNDIDSIAGWTPVFERMYEKTAQSILSSKKQLQVAPGVLPNFYATSNGAPGCSPPKTDGLFPARSKEDFKGMMEMALRNAKRQSHDQAVPLMRVYKMEGFEGTWGCASLDEHGNASYPNHYGCDPISTMKGLLK